MFPAMLRNAPVLPYIPVSDMKRARRFYEQTIGLKPRAEEPEGGVLYECGDGTTIFMYQSFGAGTSTASQAYFTVPDVAAEVADLKSRGVQFLDYDLPQLKTKDGILVGGGAAWFKDSEGNIMAVIQKEKPKDKSK
jgi:predicted enzyme related to lactoylglutathione lyase